MILWECSNERLFINNSHSDILINMVKWFLKILILIFLLESTWAVAAQYCAQELGLKANHFGHHYDHKNGNKASPDQSSIQADKSSKSDKDKDCPYCHLGAMKTIIHEIRLPAIVLTRLSPAGVIHHHYVNTVPRQPERPNWISAV